MSQTLQCITPVDGSVYLERETASAEEIKSALAAANAAQANWAATNIRERAAVCSAFVDAFIAQSEKHAEELAWQMGRPIRYGAGEVNGLAERARYMISVAEEALADVQVGEKEGFTRYIKRAPVGVVLTIAPWNFPLMTAVNSVIPALMAGNAVILKHATQTLRCAEAFSDAFAEAGLPDGLFQVLHLTHQDTADIIQSDQVNFVSFTGSVRGGEEMEKAASGKFLGLGLELGGKDPAYVRADADIGQAAEGLVDGAFFNSGQSCCGIERIYVHTDVYDAFVAGAVALVKDYKLDSPLEESTTLGPMVNAKSAQFVRTQVRDAVAAGARALVDPALFPADDGEGPYCAPQVLVDVNHSMSVMRDESFGPVVGIMKVSGDDEAVGLMNDSEFGLTASIWTRDLDRAVELGERVNTGTLFMNRCDYLDPALAWTGVKNTGRGCSLSKLGYEQLTRPKSYHLKHA